MDLVEELPADWSRPRKPKSFDPDSLPELVSVYHSGRLDTEMVRSLLEGNGITAYATNQTSGAYPVTVGYLAESDVLVRAEDADRAREVIAEAQSGSLDEGERGYEEPDPRSDAFRYAVASVVLILFVLFIWGNDIF